MTRLRRLVLPCLLLLGLAGCTEGQKTNPRPRASAGTAKATERGPDLDQAPIAAPPAGDRSTEKR